MTKIKIKKGDTVIAITGRNKNKTGEVLQVLPEKRKVIVSGLNLVKKHQKPTGNSTGGIVEKELPIDVFKVALLDPKENKATKVGYKIENGSKVRYAKLSGSVLEDKYKK